MLSFLQRKISFSIVWLMISLVLSLFGAFAVDYPQFRIKYFWAGMLVFALSLAIYWLGTKLTPHKKKRSKKSED